MKYLKGCLVWIGLLVLVLMLWGVIIGGPKKDEVIEAKAPAAPVAAPVAATVTEILDYPVRLQSVSFYRQGSQRRGRVFLQEISLEQSDVKQRAMVAAQFAKEVAIGRGLDFVDVVLVASGTEHINQNVIVAKADYARHVDKVPSMDKEWEIKAADARITPDQVRVANAWQRERGKFLDKDGDLNEERLAVHLAKMLSLPVEAIGLPFVYPDQNYQFKPYAMSDDNKAVLRQIFAVKGG